MLNRAREWWENLGRNNQIILVASSFGGLVALIGFIAWASTPEYVPLFSNLSAQDANTIREKLKEANVPNRLTNGATTIEVPSQNAAEMRMKMLSQGLPSASATLGYEILDNAPPLMTGPIEASRLIRAKEGEIVKSLMALQQVSSAIVHLAPADDTLFVRDKHDASASVVLTLKPGASFNDENTNAIVRLVQMSYTGLMEKNISVADSQGNLLFDGTRASTAQGLERKKQEHAEAQAWTAKLQGLLDRTIGPRKTAVIVNYELTSEQEQSEKTTYEPGAVIDKTSETEKLNGQGTVQPNAPGAGANLNPGTTTPAAGRGAPGYVSSSDPNGNFTHETTHTSSQPSVTKTVTNKPEGRIAKLTVSALVDSKVPQDQIASITAALRTAIGVDPNDPQRTREVSVAQVPFDRSAEDQERLAEASSRRAESTAKLVSILVPLGLMIFCFFLLARALRKQKPLAQGGQLALAGGGTMPFSLGEAGNIAYGPDGMPLITPIEGETTVDEHGNIIAISNSTEPHTFEVIEQAFDANMESILHLTRSKPETVAMLVKSWITDEA